MILFQVVFIPLCLFFAARTLLRARTSRLMRWQSTVLALVWVVAALLIWYPTSATIIASWLGIGRGSDLILYLGLLAGLQASIFFYNRYRRLEIVVTELVRQNALLGTRRGGDTAEPEPAGPEAGALEDARRPPLS